MDPYANKEASQIPMSQWVRPNDRLVIPKRSSLEPKIDELVSKIVGCKVYMQDPRLIALVVKWKKESSKTVDSAQPDNYLNDPHKINELKEVFK